MGWFSKKPSTPVAPVVPSVGSWVRDFTYEDHGYGQMGKRILDTFHWEGPEPPDGRPMNPANTDEFKANLQRKKEESETSAAYYKAEQEKRAREEADRAEEKQVCSAAIAELKARRAAAAVSGGKRKTQKRKQTRKRVQKKRKSYKRA